ncbi:anthrax toxin receptor-like isoform X2 [Tamandua tetradactyla]|uniref:anthrax toxin receptor-like isoform X2 n=1 Tax=Tamandua tetradactyla TaxID=48850 RepID=UPI0040549F68
MGSCAPPAPFWLLVLVLLLLLPTQLPGAEGRPHLVRGGRSVWSQTSGSSPECKPSYHLHFVLEKSDSVRHSWPIIAEFVTTLVEKLKNPNMPISFITSSAKADIIMLPTTDAEALRFGIKKLKNQVNTGSLHINEGLKKANAMINGANSGGMSVASVVVIVLGSPIPGADYPLAVEEAKKARDMGAIVFCVGLSKFQPPQAEGLADSKGHVFGVPGRSSTLPNVVPQIMKKLCILFESLEPTSVCMGEEYQVVVRGHGFLNALEKERVMCKFKFSRTKFEVKAALSLEDKVITCPGVQPQVVGKPIAVEVSLNNGIFFFRNNLRITGKQCEETPASPPGAGDSGSPSEIDSQILPAKTQADAPEKPLESAPEVLPKKPPKETSEKAPEEAPEKPVESPGSPPENPNEEDDEEDEEGYEEGSEGGYEDDVHESHETHSSGQGSSSEGFPMVPVLAGVAGLLALLLLLCCLWYLCRREEKEPPPPPPPPSCEKVCPLPCPIMMSRCCACYRSVCPWRQMEPMEGQLDLLSNPRCSPLRLMASPFRTMERCLTLTPVRSPYTPMVCGPSQCLPPSREQVPFPVCPPCCHCHCPWSCSQSSRMLPLVPPCSRALPSCHVQALPPEP